MRHALLDARVRLAYRPLRWASGRAWLPWRVRWAALWWLICWDRAEQRAEPTALPGGPPF